MTILNVSPTASITADATPSITSLPFSFEVFQPNQVKVTVSNTALDEEQTLALGVGYTVTLDNRNLPKSSGRVDLLNPLNTPDYLNADGTLKDGWTLSLQRVVPIDQRTAFNNLGPFFPRSLEDSLDKLTMIIQDIIEGGAINIDAGAVIDFTLFGLTVATSGDMVTLQITYNGQAVGSSVTFTAGGGGTGSLDFSMLTLTVDANGVLTLSDGTDSISADLSSLITTHNTDTTAHQDIRDSVGTAVTTHNAANDAHQDIRDSVGTAVTAHNAAADAHQDIRDSVDTAVTAHNTDATAHQSIRDGVDTSIETHNTSNTAHNDIRTSIQNIINAGAIPVWSANTAYNVNDILSNSGTLYRVTTAGTSAATIDADITGGLNLVSMTAHRAELSAIEGLPRRESSVYFATDSEEWLFDDGTNLHRVGRGAALAPDLSNLDPKEAELLAARGKGLEFEYGTPHDVESAFPLVADGTDIGIFAGIGELSGDVVYLSSNGYVSNSADQLPNITRYSDFNSIGSIEGELWFSAQIDGSTNHQLFRFVSGVEEVSTLAPTGWDILDFDHQDTVSFVLARDGTTLKLGRKPDGEAIVWRDLPIPPDASDVNKVAIKSPNLNTFYVARRIGGGTDFFLGIWGDSDITYQDTEHYALVELSTPLNGFIILNDGFVTVSEYYFYNLPRPRLRHTKIDSFLDQTAQDAKDAAGEFGDTAIRADTGEILQHRGTWDVVGAGTRLQNLATDLSDAEKREAGIRLGSLLGADPRENQILEGLSNPSANHHVGSVQGNVYSGIVTSFFASLIRVGSTNLNVSSGEKKMKVTYRGQEIKALITDNLDQISLFIERDANIPFSALPNTIRFNVQNGNLGTGTLTSTDYLTTFHAFRAFFDSRDINADVAVYSGGTGNLNLPPNSQITEIVTTGGELEFDLAPVGQVYGEESQIYLEFTGATVDRIWRQNNGWRQILDLSALNADDLQNLQDALNEKENLILTGTGAPAGDTAGKANQWLFVIPTDTLTEIWRNDGTEATPNWAKKIDFDDFATNTALQTTNNNVALLNTSVSTLSTTVTGKMDDDFDNVEDWNNLTAAQRTKVLETLFRGLTLQQILDLHARIFATVNGVDRVSLFNHMVRGTSANHGVANQSPSINADNDDMIWVDNLRANLSNVGTVSEEDQQAFRQAVGLGAASDAAQPQNLYGTRDPREIEGVPITNPALGQTSGGEGLLMTRADIAYTNMAEPYTNQVANIRVTHGVGGSNVHVLMQPESTSVTTVAVPGSIPDDDLPVRITAVINDITVVFTRALVSGVIRYTLTDNSFVDAKRVLYTTSPAVVPHQGTLSSITVQDDPDATNPLRFEVATIGTGVIPALEGVDTQLYFQRLLRDNDFIAAIWEYKNDGWTKAINLVNNAVTTENPNEVTVGAQSYASDPGSSDTDVVGFIFLGDQHEVTNLNDVAWRHHGNDYFIEQGLEYFSLRRIRAIHPILQGKEIAISAVYEPLNQIARVLIIVEQVDADRDDLNALFDHTSTLYMANTNITLRWFNVNYDFNMNLGSGSTVNCTIFEYVDKDASGHQIHIGSYEEFLELYQFDKTTKFFSGGTVADPIGIAPADNLDFIPYPSAQVIRKEDDGSYTEYIYENERYINSGNSAAPRHSESDTSPIVTKIIRTAGAGPSPGFQGNLIPPNNNEWMLFPSTFMTSSFIIRGTTNNAPVGYNSNWTFKRRQGANEFEVDACLIINRGVDRINLLNLDLLVNRISVQNREAINQITGIRLTVEGTSYDLPVSARSYIANPPPGTQPFTIDRDLLGTPAPADHITFDISSLPTVNLAGSTATLDFEILVTGVPSNTDPPVEAVFERFTDPDQHVRVQREATAGSTHFDRLTQQAYIQCDDVWRHLQIETAAITVSNRSAHQNYDINPNVRKYVFDMRESTGSITVRFDAADHTPGTTWVIERIGETYLTDADTTGRVDQEASQLASSDLDDIDNIFRDKAIHARNHGFIQGTPFTVHFSGTHSTFGLSTGRTYWVRDVWSDAFTIVNSFDKVTTGGVNDLVNLGVWPTSGNPATRNTVTFRPSKPDLKVELPFKPSRYLRHDRQRLVVDYPNHDIRLESNFIHPIGWRNFSKIESTGAGNPFASLGDVRGAWTIDNSHIHFEVVGRITNTGNLDIEDLRSHSIIMPFGLTVHNPFRRMFLENPSTSGSDRDLEMLVGRVNYQQRGGADGIGDNWGGLLRLQKDEFNRLRPHSFQSLEDPQNDPEDQDVVVGDMVWFSWKIPTSDFS